MRCCGNLIRRYVPVPALAVVILSMLPLTGMSATVDLGTLVIARTFSYQQTGQYGGDVIVYLPGQVNSCDGVWLAPADAGYKTNVAMVTTALVTGRRVRLYADNAIIWSNSAAKFCKLYAIGFEP